MKIAGGERRVEDHVDYQSVISDLKDLMLDSQVLLYYHTLLLYSSYPDYYSYIFLEGH